MDPQLKKAKQLMKMTAGDGEPSFADGLSSGKVDMDFLKSLKLENPFDKNFNKYFKWADEYLRAEVDPADIERNAKVPLDKLMKLSQSLLGAKIPAEYNGLGLSTTQYCYLMKLLSSCHSSLGIWFTANCSIGLSGYLLVVHNELKKEKAKIEKKIREAKTPPEDPDNLSNKLNEVILLLERTEWQMSEFLPKLAAGANAGFGLTQQTAGSDPGGMIGSDTRAHRIGNGKIRLVGHKLYNTNATLAEFEVIMAPGPDSDHEISTFIVPTRGYGKFHIIPLDFAGNRGIENGAILFNVIIPEKFMVGRQGEGLKNALKTLNVGRLAMAAGASASIAQCLQISRWWCKVRVQMGLPIGKYKQNAVRVARMASNAFAVEALMHIGASVYDQFKPRHDMRLMTAAIKYWSTEMALDAAIKNMQIRSGHGYETYESQVRRKEFIEPHEIPLPDERFIDDSLVMLIGEGTSDIQKLVIFGVMASPHLARVMPIIDSSLPVSKRLVAVVKLPYYLPWIFMRFIKFIFSIVVVPSGSPLRKHVSYINRQSQKMALKLLWNLAKDRVGLLKENIVTGFMAKQITELMVMSFVCRYAEELYSKCGNIVFEVADVFCGYARARINGLHEDVPMPNVDAKAYKLAQKIIFPDKNKDGKSASEFLEKNIISILEREIKRHGDKLSYT
ncbi:MAG: acyl-CoA dehydrogenase family protein [bacterium]|nr:acyl-CoA dehydrogenase family protein [bacterium]